eukprot:1176160-Prorocentrum_minimum.AAC.7
MFERVASLPPLPQTGKSPRCRPWALGGFCAELNSESSYYAGGGLTRTSTTSSSSSYCSCLDCASRQRPITDGCGSSGGLSLSACVCACVWFCRGRSCGPTTTRSRSPPANRWAATAPASPSGQTKSGARPSLGTAPGGFVALVVRTERSLSAVGRG